MKNKTKIFILAGGFGSRLKSVISDIPKPMAPIFGKPFLEYQISFIRQHFVDSKIYLLTHYLSEIIEKHFKDIENIEIIKEEKPLGTGGSIKNALNFLKLEQDSSLLILNGDTYIEPNLIDFINSSKYDVNILASFENNGDRYGTLNIKKDKIVSFKEKEIGIKNNYINAGCYYFKSLDFFRKIEDKYFAIEKEFENFITTKNNIGTYKYKDIFIDIGIPEDYEKMNNYIKEIKNGN